MDKRFCDYYVEVVEKFFEEEEAQDQNKSEIITNNKSTKGLPRQSIK